MDFVIFKDEIIDVMLQASSDNHVAKDEDLHGHVHKKISVASHVAKEI